jgi:hypothetical protein
MESVLFLPSFLKNKNNYRVVRREFLSVGERELSVLAKSVLLPHLLPHAGAHALE